MCWARAGDLILGSKWGDLGRCWGKGGWRGAPISLGLGDSQQGITPGALVESEQGSPLAQGHSLAARGKVVGREPRGLPVYRIWSAWGLLNYCVLEMVKAELIPGGRAPLFVERGQSGSPGSAWLGRGRDGLPGSRRFPSPCNAAVGPVCSFNDLPATPPSPVTMHLSLRPQVKTRKSVCDFRRSEGLFGSGEPSAGSRVCVCSCGHVCVHGRPCVLRLGPGRAPPRVACPGRRRKRAGAEPACADQS